MHHRAPAGHSHRHHHWHTRADPDSSNNTVIIVAVVCGCVGGVVVLGLLWTLSRRIFRPTAAPLPPRQPLVNQRQRHLANFHQNLEDRKTKASTWFDADLAPVPPFSATASSTSLIPPRRERESSVPSTSSTFFGQDDTATPSSEFAENPVMESDHLPLPNRPFVDHRSSAGSSSQGSSQDSYPPSRSGSMDEMRQPSMTALDAPPSPPSASYSEASLQPRPRPRTRSRSRVQSRPQSFASSAGSYNVRSGGVPHRQSRMQIVLPAPLAPELYPFDSETTDDTFSNRRFTMVGEEEDDFAHYRERTVSDAWASPSVSRSNSRGDVMDDPPGPVPSHRPRLQRQNTSSSTSSSSTSHYHQNRSLSALPPVPSIPASYASHSVSPLGRTSIGASNEYFDPADVAEVDEDGTRTIREQDKSSEHKLQKARSKSRGRGERERSRGRKGRQGTT